MTGRDLFRFRLSSLLLMATAVAVLLTWQIMRVQRERQALQSILQSGGRILAHGANSSRPSEPRSAWNRRLVRLGDIAQVDTWGEVSDELVRHLKDLPQVEELNLAASDITDLQLQHVGRAQSLKGVILDGTQISDAGLAHLGQLTGLERLSLGDTNITDAGLGHLAEMNSLWKLVLMKTAVTDAGLEHLKKLPNLRVLHLTGTQVTGEGIRELQQALPNCKIYP